MIATADRAIPTLYAASEENASVALLRSPAYGIAKVTCSIAASSARQKASFVRGLPFAPLPIMGITMRAR
jgi:hypothetical protein